jgi:hypothetical protein
MMMWLSNLFTAPRKLIHVVRRDQTQVTLEEWRTNPAMVKMARKFLDDPQFMMLVDVLRNAHFINYSLPVRGVVMEDRAAMQARGEGYTACINNMFAMGEMLKSSDELKETFESEETPTDIQMPNT